MNSIKDMVKNKTVSFICYRDKELWYTTECGFQFPVPIEDTGTGVFKAQDKALMYMRWIRKYQDKIEQWSEERLDR